MIEAMQCFRGMNLLLPFDILPRVLKKLICSLLKDRNSCFCVRFISVNNFIMIDKMIEIERYPF